MNRDHDRSRAGSWTLLIAVLLLGWVGVATAQPTPAPATTHAGTDAPSTLVFTPETCPLMPWEPVDPTIFVEQGGRRVYLCCNKCKRKWLAGERPDTSPPPPLPPAGPGTSSSALPASGPDAAREAELLAGFGARRDPSSPAFCPSPVPGGSGSAGSFVPVDQDPSWTRRLGRLHPVAVHFPVALIWLAAIGELLALVRRTPLFVEGARFALVGAAVGAIPALAAGLAAGGLPAPGEDATLALHRTLGAASTVAILVTLAVREAAHRRDSPGLAKLARVLVLATAILVGAAGHQGGILVYGP